VLSLACFASGAVDIISFVKLGGVFASAMTGNLAFLALHAANALHASPLAPALSLGSFVTATALAARLVRGKTLPQALTILLIGETCLLLLFTFNGISRDFPVNQFTDLSITFLSAAMGMQIVIGRTANRSGIPTVVFTSTLTGIVIETIDACGCGRPIGSPETLRRLMVIAGYFAGAFAAGIAIPHRYDVLGLIPAIPIMSALALQWYNRGGQKQIKRVACR
jgi:uncharacterized membrane protein YoaK (UPF0700 family)